MSDRDDTIHEFEQRVNTTAMELEDWRETDESKAVGQKTSDGESTGHASGRAIVELLRERKADDDDGDVAGTPWCASLKNWGHDPTP